MVVIFGFLSVLLFIALVVGLVNPPLILRGTENPTRLKVLGYWFISYIVLAITMAMMQAISEKSNDDLSNEIKTSVDNTINEEQFSNKDVEVNNEETTKLKESLERELSSINKGIDFSEYHKSHESLKWELILFNVWAQRIKEGEKSNDIEVQNLAKELKDQVIDIQGKEFPKLRKLFIKYGEQQISIKSDTNIKMSTDRSDNGYINFISEIFMLESHAKILHETIESTLIDFRFRQARYKKYKGDEDYIYFDLNSPYDRDIYVKDF